MVKWWWRPVEPEAAQPDPPCQSTTVAEPLPVVVVFDGSGSMEPILATAKQAVRDFVGAAPNGVDVGMVVFNGCGTLTRVDFMPARQRPEFLRNVEAIAAQGGTALAESLQAAGDMLAVRNPRDALIVLMTDGGAEGCSGDPGAVARSLKARMPGLTINIVALAGDAAVYAEIAAPTGGKVVVPSEGAEFARALRQATTNICR